MEMVRTFIIALFFAAVTVGAYYFLHNSDIPWDFGSADSGAEETPSVMIVDAEPMVPEPASTHPDTHTHSTAMALPDLSQLPGIFPDSSTGEVPMPEVSRSAATPPAPRTDIPDPAANAISSADLLAALPGLDHISADPAPSPHLAPSPQPPSSNYAPHAAPELTPEVQAYLATAATQLQQGNYKEVLEKLSPYYGDPRLTPQESELLTNILTHAATMVVFSRNLHVLEPAYIVQPGDTLESIAAKYTIPTEFIARINGISAQNPLQPGLALKVLRGPFHARVYLDRYEMILTLNGLFAVRFWIGVGGDLTQHNGQFAWNKKEPKPDYQGTDNTYFHGADPNNPLGGMAYEFVDLRAASMPRNSVPSSAYVCVHGTPDVSVVGRQVHRGNIILSKADMESLDVLLGRGSIMSLHQLNPHATGNSQFADLTPPPTQEYLPGLMAEETPDSILSPINSSVGQSVSMPGMVTDEMPVAPAPSGNRLPDYVPDLGVPSTDYY